MAAPPPPPPSNGGLSLYENLLDPNDSSSASATISSAPVLYNQTDSASAETTVKKPIDPALRFQPIRRPQVKQTKPKPTFPKAAAPKQIPAVALPAPAQAKTTLADWAATEEDEWMYGMGEKRQRGGRKKKKKRQQEDIETNWDDIYDPTRPTNVEEYLHSDEKVQEVRDWKALLYRHRRKRVESDLSDEDEDEDRPVPSSEYSHCYMLILLLTCHQTNSLHPPLTPLCHHRLSHLRRQLQHLLQTMRLGMMHLLAVKLFPRDNQLHHHHRPSLLTQLRYHALLLDIIKLRTRRIRQE